MTENKTPQIQPIKLKEYETKQSKYGMVPQVPFRSIVLGPSGSGKTILLQNMILYIYRDCFSRIYIFSPSIEVDSTWLPVKHYIEHDMKVQNTKEDPIYFDHYEPENLHKIIDAQHKCFYFYHSREASAVNVFGAKSDSKTSRIVRCRPHSRKSKNIRSQSDLSSLFALLQSHVYR